MDEFRNEVNDFEYAASAYITFYGKKPKSSGLIGYGHATSVLGALKIRDDYIENIKKAGSRLSFDDFSTVREILLREFNDHEDQDLVEKLVDDAISIGKINLDHEMNIDDSYYAPQ